MRRSASSAADQARLQRWVDSLPVAVAELERGAGPLDFSRDSLLPVWEYALSRIAGRDVDPRARREDLPPLPEWTEVPGRDGVWSAFSIDTLWLIDAVARYYAECLLQALPEFRWAVYEDRKEAGMEDGEICLVLGRPNRRGVHPMTVFLVRDVLVQAGRVVPLVPEVSPPQRVPTALRDIHDMRLRTAVEVLSTLRG